MNKLRIGIVGTGGIAETRYIPAFMKLKEFVSIDAVQDSFGSLADG